MNKIEMIMTQIARDSLSREGVASERAAQMIDSLHSSRWRRKKVVGAVLISFFISTLLSVVMSVILYALCTTWEWALATLILAAAGYVLLRLNSLLIAAITTRLISGCHYEQNKERAH